MEQEKNIDPQDQKHTQKTNEFYHMASQALGVPKDSGKRISQCILRNIVKRIHPNEAKHLISELPYELKQECSECVTGPDKSIDAEKFKSDIIKASQQENIDPEEVAKNFWSYLTGWLNEYEGEKKGETFDVLDNLPKDVKALFGHPIQ
ncbi:MAG: hypothetical protein CME64_06530 [Halobacteriovoraceae bacterium]|nr:hypothetical protein [Halobacteriovoraceae bacterium]|tara:strand:- start:44822 stop:45268 length:447 start_codon:yes stop_codon:yes gene_type:complete